MSVTHITSTAHLLIKQRRKLHEKKGRVSQGLFIAEGVRMCETLIASPLQLAELFITNTWQEEALRLAPEEQIIVVNDLVMKKLSTATTPSGMLGVFKLPETPDTQKITSGIVLTKLADPGNMGTLIRTCAALGIHAVICIEGVDPWSPKVVQASAGAIGYVTICNWSWQATVQYAQELGITLAALVVSGGVALNASLLQNPYFFIIGNEAHGIPDEYAKECTHKITLPMPGNTESLNAAVAGSIMLYLQYLSTQQYISFN